MWVFLYLCHRAAWGSVLKVWNKHLCGLILSFFNEISLGGPLFLRVHFLKFSCIYFHSHEISFVSPIYCPLVWTCSISFVLDLDIFLLFCSWSGHFVLVCSLSGHLLSVMFLVWTFDFGFVLCLDILFWICSWSRYFPSVLFLIRTFSISFCFTQTHFYWFLLF